MTITTAPIINPNPAPDLIAALAGETVCRHCGGRGVIAVTSTRDTRACPVCRGTGLIDRRQPQPDPRPF